MSETAPFAFLPDARVAGSAVAPLPAWLWALDGRQILWANAAGAAVFASPSPAALKERRFAPGHPAAAQVARLAEALPPEGAPRLQRLRGFASGVGRLLTCNCSQLALADGTPAILIVAAEPAGPSLTLSERVRRLLDGFDGPLAAFSPEGELLHATPQASRLLGSADTLDAAGAATLASTAVEQGEAAGDTPVGAVTMRRIGSGNATVLIASLAPHAPAIPQPQQAETPATAAAARPEPPILRIEPVPASPERRHPLRFVWQIDADNRFTVTAQDFIDVMGPGIAASLGKPWSEVASELGLDPDGRLNDMLAARDTFSGVVATWPVEGTTDRVAVELSGLPVFDRGRTFCGFRGFGVCRDVARLDAIIAARRMPFVPAAEAAPAPAAKSAETEDADRASAPPADAAVADGQATADRAELAAPSPDDADAIVSSSPDQRPQLTVVPASKNVVPFRSALPAAAEKRPALSPVERTAFQEIAKALGARMEGDEAARETGEAGNGAAEGAGGDAAGEAEKAAANDASEAGDGEAREAPASDTRKQTSFPRMWPRSIPSAYAGGSIESGSLRSASAANGERAVLDRLPVGVLVYRGEQLLHANRALLEWTGYEDLQAIADAGGLERLLTEPGLALLGEPGGSGQTLAITTRRGESLPVEGRLFSVSWQGATALLLVLVRTESEERVRAAEEALRAAEARAKAAEAAVAASEERLKAAERAMHAAQAATRERESVLETATDGVVVVDHDGMIVASSRSAEALFGYESHEIVNRSFLDLFAPESHRAAQEYLNGLIRNGVASVLNDGREVIGRVQQGGLIPLFMTIGRISEDRLSIVFRDITQWKRAEEDLTNSKREAEKASSAKSDFLAKVSHEIRTPLNAIIGFAEVMMDERFGPIANDRYRQYLKDIRASGEHVISLVNDLLDLSKIEAGKLELTFVSVNLNDAVQQCVAIMQPQANRERIIIRTSLLPTLPPVVADERSIRQIVLNLLSNSIKFTGAGGQVIVSTALTDHGEAVLRVRDTGIGMSEKEIATALEPFRQVVTSGRAEGTGLGLPLTKALAEANRASFNIKSAVDAGTLVEIAFPATRVLAE
jgi:PAS domain S-box-containing protein